MFRHGSLRHRQNGRLQAVKWWIRRGRMQDCDGTLPTKSALWCLNSPAAAFVRQVRDQWVREEAGMPTLVTRFSTFIQSSPGSAVYTESGPEVAGQ